MNAIESAISKAYDYLTSTELSEFSGLRHGPSDATDWAGAFIWRCLPDLPGVPSEVFNRFSALSSTDLDSEANWCLALDRPLKGWWDHLVSQCSSPPWLCALSTYTLEEVKEMYPLSGGDSWNPTRMSWCRGVFEVSALALQCRWELDLPGLQSELLKRQFPSMTCDLITSKVWEEYVQQRVDNIRNWILAWLEKSFESGWARENESFWWSTNAYGWHQVAEVNFEKRPRIKSLILKCLSEPSKLCYNRHGELCIFTTALNLMTLLKLNPTHPSIPHMAELCLMGQQSNGSWTAPPILRIPEPRPLENRGASDRRIPEDKGLLTTATVTQALKRYKQHCEEE